MLILNLCRSPLISLRSLIQYVGSVVKASTFFSANLFCGILLESPLVGSEYTESFYENIPTYPLLSISVFAYSIIWKDTVSY